MLQHLRLVKHTHAKSLKLMVSLAGNIKTKAKKCVHARWLIFDAVLRSTHAVFQKQKKFVRFHHVSLLPPSRSDASGISTFLLATRIIDRGKTRTKLQFIKRNIGADISETVCKQSHSITPALPQIWDSYALTVTPHFHAAESPSSESDPALVHPSTHVSCAGF